MSVQPDRSPHARPGAFTRPDDRGMGTESEVSKLIAAHVRWLKPSVVVETGTFHADTSVPIAKALFANQVEGHGGHLFTFEVDHAAHAHAIELLPHPMPATAVLMTLQDYLRHVALPGPVDIAFVDSAYAAREADVETLAPLMAPCGLLFVHDAAMPPMRPVMARWRETWHVIEYPTPRGLALLQRR